MAREYRSDAIKESQQQSTMNNNEFGKGAPQVEDPLFDNAIVHRDYSSDGGGIQVVGEIPDRIPEPETTQRVVDFNNNTPIDDYQSDAQGQQYSDDGQYSGSEQGFTQEPEKDKKQINIETKNLADSLVDMLKFGYQQLREYAKKSEDKLQFKAARGKFNIAVLDSVVDLGGGCQVRMRDFLDNYNNEIERAIQLDPEREAEMRQLIRRIAQVRGMGMSDELRLGIMLGQEVIEKGGMLYALSGTMNDILKNQERLLSEQAKKPFVPNPINPTATTTGSTDEFKEHGE